MVALWICFCAFLSCAGWALSVFHMLNATGYSVAFLVGVGIFVAFRKFEMAQLPQFRLGKIRRRFSRAFPLAFLILAVMAILGGVLHPPSNYDGLTYRTPRVLHWLAEGRWHWVQTDFPRLNVRATGYEWVTAPMLSLMKTDRWTFLICAASFLLLPGLVFSLLHRVGVRRRVAWYWMWILPTGYGYLLQAGSIANDLFGAVFGLAAVDFALRARTSRRIQDVWLSLIAAALVTNAKATNLALGLPWLLAIYPAVRVIRKHLSGTFAVALIALLVSVVPISILNVRHCGDWSGQVLEHSAFGGKPVFRLAVNTVGFTLQNFVPPIFPLAKQWNEFVLRVLPSKFAELLRDNFEPAASRFALGEMQNEESAGLGFGVCVLLAVSVIAAWRACGLSTFARPNQLLVCIGGWISVLVFMSQSGLSGAVRYLAPYYVLLVAPFLAFAGQALVVKRRWWRAACAVVFAFAALLLIINPARPLWPAVITLRSLGAQNSSHHLVQRAWAVYSVYNDRADCFAKARALLPPDANPLGYNGFDSPETSLWRPFGSRRILHVKRNEGADELRARGIKYILASQQVLKQHWRVSEDEWLAEIHGEVVTRIALNLRAAGTEDWVLVRLP